MTKENTDTESRDNLAFTQEINMGRSRPYPDSAIKQLLDSGALDGEDEDILDEFDEGLEGENELSKAKISLPINLSGIGDDTETDFHQD